MSRPRASLLLFLAACAGDGLPSSLRDCADTTCQARWVEQRWAEDPEEVAHALKELEDPVARTNLVRTLTTAHPGEATPLCDLLSPSSAQQDCRNRNRRPHLLPAGKGVPRAVSSTREPGESSAGPESHGLAPLSALRSPWAETAPETVTCAVEARVCQSEAASTRAAAGDTAGAAAACNAVEASAWRDECFFQAGEQAARARAADNAVALCMAAGSFVGRCLSHVVREVGALAPVASSGAPAAWTRLIAAIAASQAALSAEDPSLAARFADQAWAWGLRSAYVHAEVVNGAPLAALPAEALPHVRAAAAWRLLGLERDQGRTLAAWTARLAEALADRTPRPATGPAKRQTVFTLRNLWTQLLPGEATLNAHFYMGPTRRAVAEEELADLAICLLEAAGHSEGPPMDLPAEGLRHADPVVRWTATRIIGTYIPSDPRLSPMASDPDRRVRERAAWQAAEASKRPRQ